MPDLRVGGPRRRCECVGQRERERNKPAIVFSPLAAYRCVRKFACHNVERMPRTNLKTATRLFAIGCSDRSSRSIGQLSKRSRRIPTRDWRVASRSSIHFASQNPRVSAEDRGGPPRPFLIADSRRPLPSTSWHPSRCTLRCAAPGNHLHICRAVARYVPQRAGKFYYPTLARGRRRRSGGAG